MRTFQVDLPLSNLMLRGVAPNQQLEMTNVRCRVVETSALIYVYGFSVCTGKTYPSHYIITAS